MHEDKCPFDSPKKIDALNEEIQLIKESLAHMRESLHTLIGRNNDIVVKVVNGKTEARLASELLGEMYLAVKDLKESQAKLEPIKEFSVVIGFILKYKLAFGLLGITLFLLFTKTEISQILTLFFK